MDFRSVSSLTLAAALFSFAYYTRPVIKKNKTEEVQIPDTVETEAALRREKLQEAMQSIQANIDALQHQLTEQQMRQAQAGLETDFAPLSSAEDDDRLKAQLQRFMAQKAQLQQELAVQ